jgi:hypothetical protein
MCFFQRRGFQFAAVLLSTTALASPAFAQTHGPTTMSATQIVEQMDRHNQSQTEALKHYQAVRYYEAEYHGFATTIEARMEVEVSFDGSSGKSFRILSQSGSKLLCEKVLKRAIESEKEASQDRGATALTPANYRLQLIGSEILNGRPSYILNVEPLKETKFLYRGKIWVDATDFAVAKIEAGPAKSPSFWISRTLIRYTSAKTGDFWLPKLSRSETKVRIGGTALLIIDYGSYQIVAATPNRSAGD